MFSLFSLFSVQTDGSVGLLFFYYISCAAAATALTVHIVLKLQHRESEEAFDRD